MKRHLRFLIVLLAAVSGLARADITVALYKKSADAGADKAGIMDAYLTGVGSALLFLNAELENKKQPPLYCQPRQVSLKPEKLRALVDSELSRQMVKDDVPISAVIIKALERAYPCT